MVVLSSSELRRTGGPRRRRRGRGLSPRAEPLPAVELRGGGGPHCGVLHSSGRRAAHSGPCRRSREPSAGDGHGEDGGDPRGSSLRPRGSFAWFRFFFFFFPAGSRFSFPRSRVSGSWFSFPAGLRFSFLRARSRLAKERRLPGACRRRLPGGEKSGSSEGMELALETEKTLEAALEAAEVELKRRLRSCGGEIHRSGGGSGRR